MARRRRKSKNKTTTELGCGINVSSVAADAIITELTKKKPDGADPDAEVAGDDQAAKKDRKRRQAAFNKFVKVAKGKTK